MTTAIIGVETSEARWRGISSAAASASCWPSGESQAAACIGRRHTMTSEPTVMRLGESVPFRAVHDDLGRCTPILHPPLPRSQPDRVRSVLLCAMWSSPQTRSAG
jgi:hypothetical protein